MSINKVHLIGHLGKDPVIKSVGEHRVASFSIATERRGYKLKSGQEVAPVTDWHQVVLWGPAVVKVIEPYVKKGTKMYIEGELRTRSFQDSRHADVTHYRTEINCTQFEILSQPKAASPEPKIEYVEAEEVPNTEEEDLPF